MGKEEARRHVRIAVDSCGLTRTEFATEANIDAGTLGDFLTGKRWPHKNNLRKIEKVLGWPSGRIDDLAEQDDDLGKVEPLTVLDAIRRDKNLLPEAKEHLLRQYRLLLRVQPEGPAADRAQAEEQAVTDLRASRRRRSPKDDQRN